MARTVIKEWRYECDHFGVPCSDNLVLRLGDRCNTGRGTVIHDQADADAAARQDGWTVGKYVFCPVHAGGAA